MPKKRKMTENDRFDKAQLELGKISVLAKEKVKELLAAGILTPKMLDFEYYEVENELEVHHILCYDDGYVEDFIKKYWVEVQIIIREAE